MSPSLKLVKKGSCEDIVKVCDNINSLLSKISSQDLKESVSDEDLERLSEEWENWRPCSPSDFSDDLRENTAEQSSIGEGSLEKEGKEAKEEIKEASNSIKKAAKEAEENGFDDAKEQVSDAVKSAGRAVDSGIRQGIRGVEENVYEKVILKTNDFYFDNNLLSVVISENRRGQSSNGYELSLHSNNPHLREFFAERVDWDEP